MKYRLALAVAGAMTYNIAWAGDFDTAFQPPAASEIGQKLSLWSTHYRVNIAKIQKDGIPLLDKDGNSIGPSLTERSFCESAMQGTVAVTQDNKVVTYNSRNAGSKQLVNCTPFYATALKLGRISQATVNNLGRMRFFITAAEFGHGVNSWHLRPYRSIAVDRLQTPVPYRSLVFIPAARGIAVTLPDGSKIGHDGYFYAVDTGGNIKTNHIDIFAGLQQSNPFPNFIRSVPLPAFEAFIVRNKAISSFMDKIHNIKP